MHQLMERHQKIQYTERFKNVQCCPYLQWSCVSCPNPCSPTEGTSGPSCDPFAGSYTHPTQPSPNHPPVIFNAYIAVTQTAAAYKLLQHLLTTAQQQWPAALCSSWLRLACVQQLTLLVLTRWCKTQVSLPVYCPHGAGMVTWAVAGHMPATNSINIAHTTAMPHVFSAGWQDPPAPAVSWASC